MFVPGKPLQPMLMFVGKAIADPSDPRHLSTDDVRNLLALYHKNRQPTGLGNDLYFHQRILDLFALASADADAMLTSINGLRDTLPAADAPLSCFQMLHSRVEPWPNQQTLDLAGMACSGTNTLAYYKNQ
jgi:hypothetical protein